LLQCDSEAPASRRMPIASVVRGNFRKKKMRTLELFILVFILSSCGCRTDKKEFNFDNNEPKHLSCYKTDDTIYFENSKSDIDTITVIKIDSAKGEECHGISAPRPTGKSCWVAIKYLPIDRWYTRKLFGNNQEDTTSFEYKKLINIYKDPIKNKTFFDFEFKDFYTGCNYVLGKLNTDTLTLNKNKITNYYIIEHGYPERITKSINIETLIWTDKDGLTAYKNKNGDWWTKKQNKKVCP